MAWILGQQEPLRISDLQPGDLIRHKAGDRALVVTANYGSRVTAVCTFDVTNPSEWVRVGPHAPPPSSDD